MRYKKFFFSLTIELGCGFLNFRLNSLPNYQIKYCDEIDIQGVSILWGYPVACYNLGNRNAICHKKNYSDFGTTKP